MLTNAALIKEYVLNYMFQETFRYLLGVSVLYLFTQAIFNYPQFSSLFYSILFVFKQLRSLKIMSFDWFTSVQKHRHKSDFVRIILSFSFADTFERLDMHLILTRITNTARFCKKKKFSSNFLSLPHVCYSSKYLSS